MRLAYRDVVRRPLRDFVRVLGMVLGDLYDGGAGKGALRLSKAGTRYVSCSERRKQHNAVTAAWCELAALTAACLKEGSPTVPNLQLTDLTSNPHGTVTKSTIYEHNTTQRLKNTTA